MKQIVKTSLGVSASALAVVALVFVPTLQVSAVTNPTTITLQVQKVISMTSTGSVGLNITPVVGGAVSSNSDTVTTSTNSPSGYTLTLADSDATTTLASGANNLTAMVSTWGSAAALTSGKWGYAIASGTVGLTAASNFDASYSVENSNATSTTKWLGVAPTGTPQTVRTTAAVATNDTTTVWYAAKADVGQVAANNYVDTVTYTATAN